MGKKGSKSRRGVGEKDTEVRNIRISVWVTKSDAELLADFAKKSGLSKGDVIIELIRNYLHPL